MGFLSLLTPCAFPMVPITISFFLKKGNNTKYNTLKNAFIYILGIIISFSLIGVVTSILYGSSTIIRLASSPWLNLAIAILFIFFAFNLFGWIDINIPPKLLTFLNKSTYKNDRISILFMGITFAITSFTCSMPLIGTILVSASQGNYLYPFIGMFCFSVSFSLPFFLLALFPSYLQTLPKSGDWLFQLKIVMGYLELAAALKFLSSADMAWQLELLTRERFLLILSFIFILLAFYLLGIFKLITKNKNRVSNTRIAIESCFAFIFLSIALYLSTSTHAKTIPDLDAFMPPPSYGDNINNVEKYKWYSNLKVAKQLAQKTNQKILIDFTGYVCVNCRYMEQNILSTPEVEEYFKKLILVRLYTDGPSKESKQNEQYEISKFKTVARPFYAIMDHTQNVSSIFAGMTRDKESYLTFLRKGLYE